MKKFKKAISLLMATICLCMNLCVTAYAEETDIYVHDEIVHAYETAINPNSALVISGTTAKCESKTVGDDCIRITVTQTLQKHSGILWFWDDVNNATWSKTVNTNLITLSTTKSGLGSGTYRLKSTFTLTSSSGSAETITIYSSEERIN